jgi:ubiquitin-conjugating enzyme E2 variant
VLEWIGVSCATVLSVRAGGRLAAAVDAGWDASAVAAGALLGLIAADLVSGIVHWAGDRFLEADTPILGPAVIVGFREHHRDPAAILRHGWFERNGMNALAVVPALVAADAVLRSATGVGAGWLLLGAALVALSGALALTNELHAWAHAPAPNALVRALQRCGLVLPPAVHARHHDGRFDSHYCVTTGWMNPILDPMVRGRSPRGDGRSRGAPMKATPNEGEG